MNGTERLKKLLFVLVVAVLVAGCEGTPVRLGDVSGAAQERKFDMSRGRPVASKACGFQLWLFIPIVTNQRAAIAYRRLQRQAENGYLTDIRVQETRTYAFVGTLYCTEMQGTVYPPA